MTEQIFPSVWDALEDTPAEAENMTLRSSLTNRDQQSRDGLACAAKRGGSASA